MDVPSDILTVSAALIALSAIAWFELRYIKRRQGERADAELEKDHAYNSLATFKAVAASLRSQGRDTSEADVLLIQAEGAFERRQYIECKELAERAKIALRNAPSAGTLDGRTGSEGEGKVGGPFPMTRSMGARKVPPNYLESRFVMECAHSLMDKADEHRREAARHMLDDAKACFEAADYDEALRHAARAKRTLEGMEDLDPALDREGGPSPRKEPFGTCAGCGAILATGDVFCHSCGRRAPRSCPSCSAEAIGGDNYCRRCGTSL